MLLPLIVCALAKVKLVNEVLTLVIFGCALVVTVPAVVAAPVSAPTKVVALNAPVAALNDKFAFADSATLPDVALASTG
jgi:hypothetical protein